MRGPLSRELFKICNNMRVTEESRTHETLHMYSHTRIIFIFYLEPTSARHKHLANTKVFGCWLKALLSYYFILGVMVPKHCAFEKLTYLQGTSTKDHVYLVCKPDCLPLHPTSLAVRARNNRWAPNIGQPCPPLNQTFTNVMKHCECVEESVWKACIAV